MCMCCVVLILVEVGKLGDRSEIIYYGLKQLLHSLNWRCGSVGVADKPSGISDGSDGEW